MKLKGQPFDFMQFFYGFVQKPVVRGCIRFHEKLEGKRLRDAIEALVLLYPILRCRYDMKMGVWRGPDPYSKISCQEILISISAGKDFSRIENDSLLSSLEIGIDVPLKIYWICGEERDSLCVIASHLLCDGRGFEQLLYLLAELYSCCPTKMQMQINTDRSFAQVTDRFTIMQKVKILFSRAQAEHADVERYLPLNESGQRPRLIVRRMSLSKLERYRSCAIEYRPSVNDILLAAYILTLHNMFGWNDMTIPCPVDLRRFNTNANSSICNLTGNYYCQIHLNGKNTFESICNKISAQMRAQKKSSLCLKEPILLHILYRMLPLSVLGKVLSSKISVPLISYTNLGKIDERRLVFRGNSVSDVFIGAAAKPVPYFQLAISTYRNQCTLSACTYARGESYDLLCSVMNNICDIIEDL